MLPRKSAILVKSNLSNFKILNWNSGKLKHSTHTAQKMKFSIKDFFSKCDQIRSKLRIWSHLPKKCLMENFTFCLMENFTIRLFYRSSHGDVTFKICYLIKHKWIFTFPDNLAIFRYCHHTLTFFVNLYQHSFYLYR